MFATIIYYLLKLMSLYNIYRTIGAFEYIIWIILNIFNQKQLLVPACQVGFLLFLLIFGQTDLHRLCLFCLYKKINRIGIGFVIQLIVISCWWIEFVSARNKCVHCTVQWQLDCYSIATQFFVAQNQKISNFHKLTLHRDELK